jgi:hypothetical protein
MQFANHTYTWSKPFTNVRHEWSLTGPHMAISFHVSLNEQYGDSAGLEIHYFDAPIYMKDRAPSHLDCKHTGGRCWHDGTSLYATDTLWPMIKPILKSGDQEVIFRILEGEMKNRDEREATDADS